MLATLRHTPRSNVRSAGPAQVNFFPIYGQSLSVGLTKALISTAPRAHAQMFSGGLRPQYTAAAPATWYTGFVAAREQADAAAPWDVQMEETACCGLADMLDQLLRSEEGPEIADAYTTLVSTPGYGSQSVANLSLGSSHFARLQAQVLYGHALSQASGKTFASQAVGWIQGETDYINGTTRSDYLTTFLSFADQWGMAAKGGLQDFVPPVLFGQVASHLFLPTSTPSIALAQADAEAAQPAKIACVCPQYIFDYPWADWHISAASTRWFGAYFALCYKRRVYDGNASYSSAMRIVSATRSGDGIDVVLDPVGHLVADTTWVTPMADGHLGFEVVDSGGAPVAVSSVEITGAATIRVGCVAGGGVGSVLRYGWSGTVGQTTPGRVTGARGNIRDDSGINFEVTPGDVRPVHRWLRISETATGEA